MDNLTFAAIDFETANYQRDSACSIGIAVVRRGRITKRLARLIRPPEPSFVFTYLHGIAWGDVRGEPLFLEVWRDVAPLLEDVPFLAAHNASFDRGVLRACCEQSGVPAPRHPFVCSLQVARRIWDFPRANLAHVCWQLGIPLDHHEAASDAEACARVLLAARRRGWIPPRHPV